MENLSEDIALLLQEKAVHKQKVYRATQQKFELFKSVAAQTSKWMNDRLSGVEPATESQYEDLNTFEARLQFGGDLLLLNMHSNVFTLERKSAIWRSDYIRQDKQRAYFGVIHLYNFLRDSFRFNRLEDQGILLARIFVNADGHYFAEGRGSVARSYNNLKRQELDREAVQQILTTTIKNALEFDLTVPDLSEVIAVSLRDMRQQSSELQLRTSKKLGYRTD